MKTSWVPGHFDRQVGPVVVCWCSLGPSETQMPRVVESGLEPNRRLCQRRRHLVEGAEVAEAVNASRGLKEKCRKSKKCREPSVEDILLV